MVSNAAAFDYDPPAITGVLPATGPALGGTAVTITGSNFGTAGTVLIGGKPAPQVSYADGRIVVTTPAGVGAAVAVDVAVTGQPVHAVASFSYDRPVVAGLSASRGTAAGGTTLTITGSNFGTTAAVTVGGNVAPVLICSDSQIVVTTPAGTGANLDVVVTAGSQPGLPAAKFTYDPPTLSSVAPNHGPAAGGTVLTITGTSFGPGTTVRVGGKPASNVTVNPAGTLVLATTPAGAGAGQTVEVRVGTNSVFDTFDYDAPAVASLDVTHGPAAGGTTLTITGTGFAPAAADHLVFLGGNPATVVSANAAGTRLVVTTPAGAGADRAVFVIVGNRPSNTVLFSYDPPTVTGISTGHGPAAGGTTLTIFGANFGPGGAAVTIGGRPAPLAPPGEDGTTENTDGRLVVLTPPGVGMDLDVAVTVGNQTGTLAAAFDYDAPTVDGLSLTHGAAGGGYTLTITGLNFGSAPTVTIGGQAAAVVGTPTDTTVVVTVPPGTGADLDVIVTAGTQSSAPDPLALFGYDPLPPS